MAKVAHQKDLVGQQVVDYEDRVDVARLKKDRLARLQEQMARLDLGGILMFDPVNVRYATGSRSSGAYNLRRFQRYALIPREGAPVLFGDMSSAQDTDELRVRPGQVWGLLPVRPVYERGGRAMGCGPQERVGGVGAGNRADRPG